MIAAAAGFAFWQLKSLGDDTLQPIAHEALTDLDAGRYEAVRERASTSFRESTTVEQLREITERRRALLGAYASIDVQGVNVGTSSGSGTGATLTTRLRYENGEIDGTFRFEKEGEAWKLAGFDLGDLEREPEAADPAPEEAPEKTPEPAGAGG